MNDQPDRQDGDGLLPCPFCGSKPVCNSIPTGVMGQIYCSNADCFGPRTTAFYRNESVKQWNTRAPTRDGAEGAVIDRGPDWTPANPAIAAMFADERKDWRADLHKRAADRDIERRTINLSAEQGAPPKPAPDEALIAECVRFAQRLIDQEGRTAEWHASAKGLPEAIAALSSAPVPPADGANIINSVRVLGPPDPSDEEFEHGWAACNEAVVELLTDLGFPRPSPAVAAEPETEQQLEDRLFKHEAADMLRLIDHIADKIGLPNEEELSRDNFNAWLATPPVRGDREAIARIVRFTLGHRLVQNISGNAEGGPVKERETETVIAEAILSLPVPPGAGEREWQLIETAPEWLRSFAKECEVMPDRSGFVEFGGTMEDGRGFLLLRKDSIEKAFDRWLRLPPFSALATLLPSRQAPHSITKEAAEAATKRAT